MKMNKITTIALLAMGGIVIFATSVQAQESRRWNDGIFGQKHEWYTSPEACTLADSVIQHQSTEGGWPRNVNMSQAPTEPAGDRANSFDNNATTQPMEFIALVASATGDAKYKASFARGLEYLFAAQYPNGGFPQRFPPRVRKNREFFAYVTYGDQVMVNVLTVLQGAASGQAPYDFVSQEQREQAAVALERGVDCILHTQIKQDGKLTGWCAQHHHETLEPAQGRDFEPPSISGAESASVVQFLMNLEKPTPQIVAAIEGAVAWYHSVAIRGMRWEEFTNTEGEKDKHIIPDPAGEALWARFYELGTMRPLFTTHKNVIKYNFSEIPHNWRLNNYTMYGTWGMSILENYSAWKAQLAPATLSKTVAPFIVEAESGTFTGFIDRHSCWHNVMLTDAPHTTHSGRGAVDTNNVVGSYIEVDYNATWSGPHRITVRYTHIKPDPRPGELLVNGKVVATIKMQQSEALPAWKTDSTEIDLQSGKNVIRLRALNEGGLPNMDYVKVAEIRDIPTGTLPRIQVLEAEDGRYSGKEDHHSCWNFIAQIQAQHSGFTGEGYVDTLNETGSYIEVAFDSATAGPHALGIRYVHGKPDTRPAEVRVNGIVANPSLAFKPTGAWTAWTTNTIPVELRAGRNVIRLTALGAEGLANTDHFAITPSP